MQFWWRTVIVVTVLMGAVFAQETTSKEAAPQRETPSSQNQSTLQTPPDEREGQGNSALLAQATSDTQSPNSAAPANNPASSNSAEEKDTSPQSAPSQHERAEQELKQEEQQRILGVVPNFNTTDVQDAAPLTAGQKFRLAFHSARDPFQILAAGLDAGISQAENNFPGYGQGAQGYGKRFGASYADTFSGIFWGNAVFPALLHEDPRYYRKGTGPFMNRLLYSIATTFWTKNDNGTWGPNYANVLGNIAAGGLANAYYPSADRGVGLTFQRAFTVTAEGTIGAALVEFWPDIDRKLFHRRAQPRGSPRPVPGQE